LGAASQASLDIQWGPFVLVNNLDLTTETHPTLSLPSVSAGVAAEFENAATLSCSSSSRTVLFSADATSLNVACPAPVVIQAPIAEAEAVANDQSFEFTGPASSCAEVSIYFPGLEWRVTVRTAKQRFTLPDLSQYGFPWPSGQAAKMTVSTTGPCTSTDQLNAFSADLVCKPDGPTVEVCSPRPRPERFDSGTIEPDSSDASRSFTTAR
jgi:hypothetical protein